MERRRYRYWNGIRGIHFIWNGGWDDSELSYRDHIVRAYDVEDYFWYNFLAYCEENGEDSELMTTADRDTERRFVEYLRECARDVKSYILDNGRKPSVWWNGIRGVRCVESGRCGDPILIYKGRMLEWGFMKEVLRGCYERSGEMVGFEEWLREHPDEVTGFIQVEGCDVAESLMEYDLMHTM